MKAAVLYEPHQPVKVEELDLDEPKGGEVRVKLVGGGVCHSDYHRIDGHTAMTALPWVLGHEGSGVVQQVGRGHECLARRPRNLLLDPSVRPVPQLRGRPAQPVRGLSEKHWLDARRHYQV